MARSSAPKSASTSGRGAMPPRNVTRVETIPDIVLERSVLPHEAAPGLRDPASRIHSNRSDAEPAL
eukprot:4243990-Prymnesium_polylepis.1